MFNLQLNAWELVLRGAVVYVVLLLMVRLSGRRTVGKFTPFDLLVVMLLGSSVSNALNGGDHSLVGGVLSAGTLMGLNMLVAFLSARYKPFQELLEGRAVLVGRDGAIYADVLKKLRVPVGDVHQALRQADCDQAHMAFAFLESDGHISVLKTSKVPAGNGRMHRQLQGYVNDALQGHSASR